MDRLTQLAQHHGTDKWGRHRYTPIYHSLLPQKTKSLLELGVASGASILMWLDYFPEATVFGVDRRLYHSHPRTCLYSFDLSDIKNYEPVLAHRYNVIIDDASHRVSDQVTALAMLWPCLQPGGYYCIEDVADPASLLLLISHFSIPVVHDLRGPHNEYDDVLVVLRK